MLHSVEGRPDKITWKCDHYNQHVISGNFFKAAYARVHLAANKSNGLCANLCDASDDAAAGRRQQFRKLIKSLRQSAKDKQRKRKQQQERLEVREASALANIRKRKQPKLADFYKANDAAAADHAVAQWAIAHDITPNAMSGPYWKMMNEKLAQVAPTYTPMYPKKIYNTMLPQLKAMAMKEVEEHLRHRPTVGRTLTGDGATKGVSLINFLVHVPGKGVKLLAITDCTGHMSEGGTKNALYVFVALVYAYAAI